MEQLDKNKSGNPMEGEARGTMSIEEFLKKDEQKDLLRFLTAGSVDDGKSTLIGRLLFDSKKLYEDQLDALERDSKRVGNAGEHIDYALLLDGLKAEREQGITIDVAYRYFSTNNRKFIIADTPGHEQYTRNMITGGSTANLAIILVDARTGVITQTRRHTYLVSLLGIKHVVLAVNKMDLVDFSKEVFDKIVGEYKAFINPLGIPDVQCIPLSALDGDNVVDKSDRTPWYEGPSLLEFLETVHIGNDHNLQDFRYPVQYVLRPNLDFRGFCGKVASGVVRKGDEVNVVPAKPGEDAAALLSDYFELSGLFTAEVSLDGRRVRAGEYLVVNDIPTTSDADIENGAVITLQKRGTLRSLLSAEGIPEEKLDTARLNGAEVSTETRLSNDDVITFVQPQPAETVEEQASEVSGVQETAQNVEEAPAENAEISENAEKTETAPGSQPEQSGESGIPIVFNGERVLFPTQPGVKPIFLDILAAFADDPTALLSRCETVTINGRTARISEPISPNDEIIIR